MPYIKKLDLRRITFAEDHELYGLELVSLPVQIGHLSKVAGLMSDIATLSAKPAENADTAAKQLAEIETMSNQLIELFAEKLKSWNFQREDEDGEIVDVPPTAEGMKSIGDDREVFAILNEWLTALAGVGPDLGKALSSGETSPGLTTLPMGPLSASPENSSEPS